MACFKKSPSTVWHVDLFQNDSQLNLLKEEKTHDAIYNVYLKKIVYNTCLDELDGIHTNPHSKSKFYLNLPTDCEKGKHNWSLREIRVIKFATFEKLVESLGSYEGESDAGFVDVFLATYRSFASPSQLLDEIKNRYNSGCSNMKINQCSKENFIRTLKLALVTWLRRYSMDFNDPPTYSLLHRLRSFINLDMKDYVFEKRLFSNLNAMSFYTPSTYENQDFNKEIKMGLMYDLDLITYREYAEQLTYIDADLFTKVIVPECLSSSWSRRSQNPELCQTVSATVDQFNSVVKLVMTTVVWSGTGFGFQNRVQQIEKWIYMAQELRRLKNFSSLKAIISGLQSASVFRLKETWSFVNKPCLKIFKELVEILSEENNHSSLRQLIDKLHNEL